MAKSDQPGETSSESQVLSSSPTLHVQYLLPGKLQTSSSIQVSPLFCQLSHEQNSARGVMVELLKALGQERYLPPLGSFLPCVLKRREVESKGALTTPQLCHSRIFKDM